MIANSPWYTTNTSTDPNTGQTTTSRTYFSPTAQDKCTLTWK